MTTRLDELRPRTAIEWAAVTAGVAAFAYVAWDSALWDARLQLVVHLGGIAVVLGLAAVALRGGALPRTPVDTPILALLAAFALATVLALNVGMSLRATASIVGWAAMLPASLLVLRRHAGLAALVVVLPVIGLAAGTLGAMLARRLEWILAGIPGIPPLRVLGEGTPFGSVAVPPFVLLATWAIAGHLPDPWRSPVRRTIVALAVPLTVLSGSRSAWLAVVVTIGILVGPALWRRRGGLRLARDARTVATVVAGMALLSATAVVAVPRLTAVTSLLYRGDLWTDTVRAWASSPWTGIGPGFMPFARHAAAPPGSFPVNQPHSHNLALGVLGDAGVIGLAAGAIVVIAFLRAAGPWRSRSARGREGSAVLIGFLVAGLFEDLTFLPGFVLLVVLLAATALLDAGAVKWLPLARRRLAVAVAVPTAAALVVGQVVADAGAIAYRRGIDALVDRDHERAVGAMARAVDLDPWHPVAPDALGIVLADAGNLVGARTALEAAVALDPGNGRAWANLAVICTELADDRCATGAAIEALAFAPHEGATLLNAAVTLDAAGRSDPAASAYRRALLIEPAAAFVVPQAQVAAVAAAGDEIDGEPAPELIRLLVTARGGRTVDPTDYEAASTQTLAAAIAGDEEATRAAREQAVTDEGNSLQTWAIVLALDRHEGRDTAAAARAYRAIAGQAAPSPAGRLRPPRITYDIGSFRAIPSDGFPSLAADLRTDPPYPWVLAELIPEP